MEHHELLKCLYKFNQYANPLDNWATDLEILSDDIRISRDYEIRHAIDFAEIFAHVYPATERTFRLERSRRAKRVFSEEVFHKYQIILALLLKGLIAPIFGSKLILLPPYLLELEDHIKWAHNSAVRLGEQLSTHGTVGILPRYIEKDIDDLLDKEHKDVPLDENEANLLVKHVKNHFGKIFHLLVPQMGKALNRIRQLIGPNGNVVALSEVFPDVNIDFERIKANVDKWLKPINIVRPRPERIYANYIDALACQYVMEVNQSINKDRQLLVLISHSFAVHEAIGQSRVTLRVGNETKEVPVLRSLGQLMAYLVHRGADDNETLNLIEDSKKLAVPFKEFKDQYPKLQELSSREDLDSLSINGMNDFINGDVVDMCAKVKYFTDSYEMSEKTNTYENLRITSKTGLNAFSKYFEEAREQLVRDLDKREVDIAIKIIRLTKNDPTIRSIMESELEAVRVEIDTDGFLLRRLQSMQSDEYRILRDAAAVYRLRRIPPLTGPLSEIAYPINFYSQKIEDLSNEILKRRALMDIRAAQQAFDKLLKTISAGEPHPEVFLLLAYLLGRPGNWQNCLAIIERGLERVDVEEKARSEFLFWKTIVLRNLKPKALAQAIDICLGALSISADDTRLLCEKGLLIWQSFATEQGKYTIDDAIEATSKALESARRHAMLEDEPIYLNLLNNLAHLYATRNRGSDLEEAAKMVDKVQKLSKPDSWPALFHDTCGFVTYQKWKQKEIGQKDLLNLAIKEVELSLHMPGMSGWQEKIAERHQALITKAIRRLVSRQPSSVG